jgi:AcrR family transcriptional regulator
VRTSTENAALTLQAVPSGADSQQDKRDRIIERAIIMFNEVGYDRVRVSDITDSLNMGKGTFYLYFQNKKELLLTCFEHVCELIQALESLPKIREGDFFTKIGPRMETVHRYDWWPGLISLLRAAELSQDAEIKAKAREALETIADPLKRDLEAAIQSGRARDVEAELVAYGFVGMAENLWFRSRLDDRYPAEQVVKFMVDAVTRWLFLGPFPEDHRQPALDRAARLISRDGTEFEIHDIRCNGETQLTGALGLAQIEIDLTRVSALVIVGADEDCLANLRTTGGTEAQLHIDGSIVVSGDASIGTVRVAMRDVSSLTYYPGEDRC